MRRGLLPALCGLALVLHGCGGTSEPAQASAQAGNATDRAVSSENAGDPAASAPSAEANAPITKRRLGPGVNTPYAEILPIALADGDTLYFTRANYPDPGMRAFMEGMMNERLERCRGVDTSVLADAARKAGTELSAQDKQMLARLSADCDKLEKIRDRDLYNFDRSPHPNQVYVSRRGKDGTWSAAERLPAPLNDVTLTNIGNVSITSASPDRRTLVLMGDFLFGKQRVDRCADLATALGVGRTECLPIAIARQRGDGWLREDRLRTEPSSLRIAVSGAALAPDGRTVVFSARDRNTRTDNHDRLFVTRWNEVKRLWSAPQQIPGLAGDFETLAPFIGPDGRSLYFASNRPGAYGGFDLYLARRQDEAWLDWSEPENLGAQVNTGQNDLSMSVDATGRYAFMASGEGTQLDIYEFNLPPNLSPAPTAIVGGQILIGGGPLGGEPPGGMGGGGEPFLLPPAGGGGGGAGNLAGGGGGGGPVQRDDQTVVFLRLSDGTVAGQAGLGSDGPTASFLTRLPVGEQYAAYVSAPGFAGIGQVIDLTSATADQRIDQDLSVARLEPGAVIRLQNIFFETDSSELLPKSRAELDRLVLTLRRYASMRIEIAGHTDARSSDTYNEDLSSRRAASVRTYLEGAGIEAGRLESEGYGERQPVASNETDEGRQLNRRVEFRILSME